MIILNGQGQVQHLRSLKRDYIRSGQRKRKVLKLGEDIEDMDEDEEEQESGEVPSGTNIDIRDVEFRLQHDSSSVRSLLSGVSSAATSHQDLMLLKLILASGLSPQVGVNYVNICLSARLTDWDDSPFPGGHSGRV